MFRKPYSSDKKLEIVILGAMRGGKNELNSRIKKSLNNILDEDEAKAILYNKGITSKTEITYPEEWKDNDITEGVLNKLDTADLIIVNITPKKNKLDPTPNVFYELALIHSLGIPHLILCKEGFTIPFYIRNSRNIMVKNFGAQTLTKALKPFIMVFIKDTAPAQFTENPISKFYGGLPVIDISATVGLATGYYMNFVRKILKENEFIAKYPEKIKKLIIVRPFNIFNTYEQDINTLRKILTDKGRVLKFEKLEIEINSNKSSIWFDHFNGIVIDIPRTIYLMKRSPRLLSLRKRLANNVLISNDNDYNTVLNTSADKLLDKVEDIINYHLRNETDVIRSSSLHFASFSNINHLLDKLIT